MWRKSRLSQPSVDSSLVCFHVIWLSSTKSLFLKPLMCFFIPVTVTRPLLVFSTPNMITQAAPSWTNNKVQYTGGCCKLLQAAEASKLLFKVKTELYIKQRDKSHTECVQTHSEADLGHFGKWFEGLSNLLGYVSTAKNKYDSQCLRMLGPVRTFLSLRPTSIFSLHPSTTTRLSRRRGAVTTGLSWFHTASM